MNARRRRKTEPSKNEAPPARGRLPTVVRVGAVVVMAALVALAIVIAPRLLTRGEVRDYIIAITSADLSVQPPPEWRRNDALLFAIGANDGNTLTIGRSELQERAIKSSPYMSTFFYCWTVAKNPVWPPGDHDELNTCSRMRYVIVYDLDFRAASTPHGGDALLPAKRERTLAVDVVLLEMKTMQVVAAGQVAFVAPARGARFGADALEARRFKRALTSWMRGP